MLTPSGQVAATYYYDAFGNVLETTGNVDNSILFAGYQYDKETGLYYLNARMYDPITARFMQEDTYLGQKNDPLSLNLYTYCHNSPLMYWDPTGHSAEYRQGGFQFGMNSTADNMAQREARRAMNRTQTGRHINNVAEAAQVSAGHGGDTFKAPTMAYHSPAIVEPLNTGYSHTLDDYAYQQTVSSQLNARQVAESTLISNPFAAEDDFYDYIRNDYYYEVAREDTIYNLIASNKNKLNLYDIENETLQNQVQDYEALYYETQNFYSKQQRLYSCVSQSVVGIGRNIKGAGDALGDTWYANFSSGKATVDWVSGDISFSEYCKIVENNEKTKRSIEVGFYNGFFEKVVNGNPVVQTQNLIGTVQYICTGDTSVLDVTGNFNKQKDEFLIETFNLNEEHFYNGESAANTTWMVGELLLSLYCIRASSSTPSLSDTPIADPYRMSYSGNAQVQMQGFTSTAPSNSGLISTKYTLNEALQKLDNSGIRPGQDVLSRSQLNDVLDGITNRYNPSKAYSSIYKDGANSYLVEGHHTTVAFEMLGKSSGPNMNVGTVDLPSNMNLHWSKKWYQIGRKTIKIID